MDKTVTLLPVKDDHKAVLSRLQNEAGTDIKLCYQCGKCSAGCPAGSAMDYTPRQIIRLLQLDLVDEALSAESIWICATCETCSARCPRGVDIASLMDTLRREALKQGKLEKKVAAFNRAFLGCVKNYGKIYELGLMLQYNIATGQFLKDADLGLPMMTRGKVGILPETIKGRDEMKQIFARVKQMGGEQ